jgi:hypothetical protein
MSTIDTESLIVTFLDDLLSGTDINESTSWAWECLSVLIFNQPETAWKIIVDIIHRSTHPMQIACVGTGALESLLSSYPLMFIERVEMLTKTDELLRKALSYADFSNLDGALQSRFANAVAG